MKDAAREERRGGRWGPWYSTAAGGKRRGYIEERGGWVVGPCYYTAAGGISSKDKGGSCLLYTSPSPRDS